MGIESESQPIENKCPPHHYRIEGIIGTCKHCGAQKDFLPPSDKPLSYGHYSNSNKPEGPKPEIPMPETPKTEQPNLSDNQRNMLSIAKLQLKGLSDQEIGEALNLKKDTISKLRTVFVNNYAPSIPTVRIGAHLALQKIITSRIIPIEELSFLPDTKPELSDEERKVRDLYAMGHAFESISDQMSLPMNKAKSLTAKVMQSYEVGNSYSLAGIVAREKIQQENEKKRASNVQL